MVNFNEKLTDKEVAELMTSSGTIMYADTAHNRKAIARHTIAYINKLKEKRNLKN